MDYGECGHCAARLNIVSEFCRSCWRCKCQVCREWIPADDYKSHIAGLHPELIRQARARVPSFKKRPESEQTSMF